MNRLYFGDNLDILKELYSQYPQGFIDLIYIDPPFNSKRNYNVLFENIDMADTKAQKEAFADTWSNVSYMDTLEEIQELDLNIYGFLKALDDINISKGAVSYLTTMAIRVWYMRKLLKETGSFYLHCDPTMSHYLKLLCDLIFGINNFRNEVIWHYRKWPSGFKQFQRNHDVLLFYSRSTSTERPFKIDYMERAASTLKRFGTSTIVSGHEENGSRTPSVTTDEESKGVPQDDVWDIGRVPPIKQLFPTQKPDPLLERIIEASSKEGDIVSDFFCGCGTTIIAAEKLNRNWLGVDISHLAIKLIAKRLTDSFDKIINKDFEVHGLPKDIASAKELANEVKGGRLEFEEWIIEIMLQGVLNQKRTEVGFDGYMILNIQGERKTVLIEVKSGTATLPQVNHFIRTVDEKKAHMGLFVCWKIQVTRGMLKTAKQQGYFMQDHFQAVYDKIQIITIEDLINHKLPNIPRSIEGTFKSAQRETKEKDSQTKLF